ncbi:hypothetical protein NUW54_g11889 [Trametes sanguinea]|uniref:Uncharacterized protein n=1 Tax=Trametes sanguinea TaxID=158606 RepID=A0ACC1N6D0_9APHY|nr:hypothetical protein NUW54_g11889 [Trametes sanguinea]
MPQQDEPGSYFQVQPPAEIYGYVHNPADLTDGSDSEGEEHDIYRDVVFILQLGLRWSTGGHLRWCRARNIPLGTSVDVIVVVVILDIKLGVGHIPDEVSDDAEAQAQAA